MSDAEWELWCEQKRRLEDEKSAEAPSFDTEKMLDWVDGHAANDDVVTAARERLDIQPLIWKRAAELAIQARSVYSVAPYDGVLSSLYKLRQSAIESLFRELREVCLVAISVEETKRRFMSAWDSQWPEGT